MVKKLKGRVIRMWPKEYNQDKALKIILFLIAPFIAMLYSIKTLNRKSSFIVFFFFSIFFGLSFTVSLDSPFDGSSYRKWFEEYRLIDYTYFNDLLTNYLTFQGSEVGAKKDFFFDFVAFYLSRVTGNYHVMFMVFAAIFGYFGLKSFRFFTQEINQKIGLSIYILAFLFLFNQIFNINGLRFWTAGWIAVYCVFQIFGNSNKQYFLLLVFLPVIHVSYWVFIGVVIVAYLLRKYERFWVVLFFASILFSSISVEILSSNLNLLPSILARSASTYTSQEVIELRNSGSGFIWVTRLMDFLVKLYINAMVYLFIKNANLIKENSKTKSLYLFLLVYMVFVNFAMPIPSLGNRYVQFSYPIIAYVWLVNFGRAKYKRFLFALPLVFWAVIVGQINKYLMVLEFDFFISNPLYLIYKYLLV